MKIRNRWTNEILFQNDAAVTVAEAVEAAVVSGANLAYADLTGADLAYAILTDANLAYANLAYADLAYAILTDANLTGANLARANLARAILTGADLTGANLTGANLTGANLAYANLAGTDLIDAGHDSRGYRFFASGRGPDLRIHAGCHYFTLAEAREHWSNRHASNLALRAECLAKIDLIEAEAKVRYGSHFS